VFTAWYDWALNRTVYCLVWLGL